MCVPVSVYTCRCVYVHVGTCRRELESLQFVCVIQFLTVVKHTENSLQHNQALDDLDRYITHFM